MALTLAQAIAKNEGTNPQYNNPGSIQYHGWSGQTGTIPGNSANVATYSSLSAGNAALQHQVDLILSGKDSLYPPNMSIADAGAKYTDNPNGGKVWAKFMGVDPNTPLSTLSSNQGTFNPGAGTGTGVNAQAVTDPNSDPNNLPDLGRKPVAFIPLEGNDVGGDVYNALFPDIVIKEGLGSTPWYQDTGLITGNPRLRQEVQPVTFKVFLDNFVLSSQGRTGQPIELQLNASMKSYSLAMKHLFHQQRTRTAQHITLWGMQADVIEGQCTTGVFMNQFGLTDYFSTLKPDDKLKQLVTSGVLFSNSASSEPTPGTLTPAQQAVLGQNSIGGVVSATQTTGSSSGYQARLSAIQASESKAFRVAAQDAFQEFLSLFKMNGSVWLNNKQYSPQVASNTKSEGNTGEVRDMTGIQAWSPQLGMNSQQENGRNNDALTRGSVVMQLRNFVYEGYFKTLSWTMDANNPYKWDFSFTFQVERTIGREYVPGQ